MKKTLSALAIISLLAVFTPAQAQDDFDAAFDKMDKAFEKSILEKEKTWDRADAALEKQWELQVKQAEEEWEKLRAAVEQKWDDSFYSTNKEWVDYGEDKDTRSRVNFEEGEIEITTLVPLYKKSEPKTEETLEAPDNNSKPEVEESAISEQLIDSLTPEEKKKIKAQAEKKIEQQLKKLFSADNAVQQEVLKDQVVNDEEEVVTTRNIADYIKKEITPKIKLDKKIIKSSDGKRRLKYTVKIKMVPRHLEIRAGRYKNQVKKYADKYKLDPALVFAVIHTESYFNPLAKSSIPAYGLMQLVPRFAAMEAYHYLHGEKKLVSPDYLYNPDHNITLGATYLHLLNNKYFGKVTNPANRQSISIAAYNCGPTRMNKTLVNVYDVNNMGNRELVKLIRKVAPAETRKYILNVQERMQIYQGI
jgi:membrane-bound lytic murein transglycosylase C